MDVVTRPGLICGDGRGISFFWRGNNYSIVKSVAGVPDGEWEWGSGPVNQCKR